MQENSNFFERIEKIMSFYSINSVNDLAINWLGYKSSQKINRLKEKGTTPSFDILNDISNIFENIDANWLLTGRGEMLKKEKSKPFFQEENIKQVAEPQMSVYKLKTDYYRTDRQTIPLYEVDAAAGLLSLFSSQATNVPLDYIDVPNAPKCDGALFVRGDSMYPILKAGDIVCYKTIFNIDNIIFGEMYILDIDNEDDQYLTVKFVQKSELGDNYIKLVSENRYHAPKDIPVSQIRALAIVKLSIRYNTLS